MVPAHERRIRVRDALDGLRHAIPADLGRDVVYYLDEARDSELALDVLVDGVIEGRVLLALDEFERIRDAMEACGRITDRRTSWLADHAMKPIPARGDDDED